MLNGFHGVFLEIYLNFVHYINEFYTNYMDLKINYTPKVHAVFFHVIDFCSKTQKGLSFFSEQAIESVHSDF